VRDQDEVWTAVAQLLRAQLTESVWYSTFQDIEPVLSDDSTLVIRVPSTLARDRIMNRYLSIVPSMSRSRIRPRGTTASPRSLIVARLPQMAALRVRSTTMAETRVSTRRPPVSMPLG